MLVANINTVTGETNGNLRKEEKHNNQQMQALKTNHRNNGKLRKQHCYSNHKLPHYPNTP
jgi:hypothetical protein